MMVGAVARGLRDLSSNLGGHCDVSNPRIKMCPVKKIGALPLQPVLGTINRTLVALL